MKINRFHCDGKEHYWHRPYERLKKHQVKETLKHGGGSLMAWAFFTWWNIGPLVKIDGIIKIGLSTGFRMQYSRFYRRVCLSRRRNYISTKWESEAYGKNRKGLAFGAEISNYAIASAKP